MSSRALDNFLHAASIDPGGAGERADDLGIDDIVNY